MVDLAGIDDLEPGATVVVACSGGADSLALLSLAVRRGFDVVAVYVDHGLRTSSAHDGRVVAEAARRLGCASRVVEVEVDASSNIEANARDARYRALHDIASEIGAVAIFVGHTRDDQAETVLLNMLRGAATSGLAGMSERRGLVRRPLLQARRSQTREWCALAGLVPAHDEMNDDTRFRRVHLRREIIPHLEHAADRELVDVIARQAALLRDDDALLDALARANLTDDAHALAEMAPALARRVVRVLLGDPPPSSSTVERVLDVATGVASAVELPGGGRVERAGGRLSITREPAPEPADAVPFALPGSTRFGDVGIEAWIEHAAPVAWPDGRTVAVCDADVVGDAAVVRPAGVGERFRPLGRSGHKLVRDALAEAGVPASRRSAAPVVAADGAIWVVGYRIDHRVRVTTQTRRYLWMRAQ